MSGHFSVREQRRKREVGAATYAQLRMIEKKYGVLGTCERNPKRSVRVVNTIENIIRCSGCRFFILKGKTPKPYSVFRGCDLVD